ncbi:MAG TPA: RNA polymerase factor sigma-54 [Saprospiraceae bacterium]|nr:RNA polymerase factor sigma-54 [Saprospiraceae bacterium]HNG89502.1 RNA polymerase factor sigma-54 [Saprospiraceae bacterium]
MALYGPKQSLTQKLQQKLSPQQIQLMKLLQIPTATLEQRIQEELEVNPALEEGDESADLLEGMSEMDLADSDLAYYEREQKAEAGNSDDNDVVGDAASDGDSMDEIDREAADDYADEEEAVGLRDDDVELDDYLMDFIEDDPSTYKTRGEERGGDEEEKTVPLAFENTFHEYLEQQLGLLKLEDEREHAIAMQIIGSIDDDGYLRRETSAMVDDLLFSQNISTDEKEILEVMKKVQQFDPPGTGARDLRECLLLQLNHKLRQDDEALPYEERLTVKVALKLISNYFDEFTKKHYPKLCRQLGVDEEDLKAAVDVILKLNPKPASGFATRGDRALNYVVPDFIVTNRDGEIELTLNSRNAPDLRINDQYREMLRAFHNGRNGRRPTKKEKEAVLFIKQKIDSAKWFIDAIKQRQQTMMLTMGAILRHQQEYFQTGDQKKIRPMILKDIADETQLDISTVSRVANSKYVQTEFGTKRLKDFFSESLSTQDGEEVSTLEVKKILTDIIGEEPKRRPLSDEKLKSILLKKGYNIARRTVAKYREQLNIPVARLRKGL